MLSNRQSLQEIKSALQNFSFETMGSPEFAKEMLRILIMIDTHFTIHTNDNYPPLPFNLKQKIIEIQQLL